MRQNVGYLESPLTRKEGTPAPVLFLEKRTGNENRRKEMENHTEFYSHCMPYGYAAFLSVPRDNIPIFPY